MHTNLRLLEDDLTKILPWERHSAGLLANVQNYAQNTVRASYSLGSWCHTVASCAEVERSLHGLTSYMRLRSWCISSTCPHRSQSTCCNPRGVLYCTASAALRTSAPRGPVQSVIIPRPVRSQSRQTKTSALQCTTDDADPGHWEYSPEWWGTQAGGWGHDSGQTLFSHHSQCGNGEVCRSTTTECWSKTTSSSPL